MWAMPAYSSDAADANSSVAESRPADVVGRSGPQSLRQRSRAPNGGREDGFSGMRLRHGSAEHVPDPNRSASMILNPVPTLMQPCDPFCDLVQCRSGFPSACGAPPPGPVRTTGPGRARRRPESPEHFFFVRVFRFRRRISVTQTNPTFTSPEET